MIDEEKPPFFVQERYTDAHGNHLIDFNDRTQLYVGFSEGRRRQTLSRRYAIGF